MRGVLPSDGRRPSVARLFPGELLGDADQSLVALCEAFRKVGDLLLKLIGSLHVSVAPTESVQNCTDYTDRPAPGLLSRLASRSNPVATRTQRKTVTFEHPCLLKGMDRIFPPGNYVVVLYKLCRRPRSARRM
jgi:hypothetical protein